MYRKSILKTFAAGETIKFSVDGVSREAIFVRVSRNILVVSENGKEEEIELSRIDRITL